MAANIIRMMNVFIELRIIDLPAYVTAEYSAIMLSFHLDLVKESFSPYKDIPASDIFSILNLT